MLSKGRENWEALDGACAGKAFLVLDRGAHPSPWLARLLRAVGGDVTLAAGEGDLPRLHDLGRFDAVFVCLHEDTFEGSDDPFSVLAVLGELGYRGRIVAVGSGALERRNWFVGAGFSAWLGRPLRAPDLLEALGGSAGAASATSGTTPGTTPGTTVGASTALTLGTPSKPARMRHSKDESPHVGMAHPAPRLCGLQKSVDRLESGR